MADGRDVLLYHMPHTRSSGVLLLLEELGVPYRLHVLNQQAGEQRQPAYLAVNPMGKVPALRHGDAVVTEQVAIYIYLADLFPEAGLAPAIGDALRGPYLRWLVFYTSSFEPAVVDRVQQREPGPTAMSPYGDFDTMLATLAGQLRQGPWLLGDRFTAADPLWGSALTWAIKSGLFPERPEFAAYLQRFNGRPAVARASARDEALLAEQARPQA
ncbi:Glutathione S-transferase [Rhodovastum atsumiense]|uniref:Glutathione S-transferase family protein n=1 Tax=Rhodovastum atsumiense TaxID=504468 RepID=A0A5M6IWR8_9PROT|nr:glutathione S-transferase family protein [Rhodovastum atsumiense]KAA5612681.1 glutathione S-transferase family protein [Rhodovastum atsumiense]CAH2602777.1 Glutathione S-transferase [Rhodovastum atsumiense]